MPLYKVFFEEGFFVIKRKIFPPIPRLHNKIEKFSIFPTLISNNGQRSR